MNYINVQNQARIALVTAFIGAIVLFGTLAVPQFVRAQVEGGASDFGCCTGSYVESVDYTSAPTVATTPSYVESIDYTYPPSTPATSATPSYVESIDYTYPPATQANPATPSYAESIDYFAPANSGYASVPGAIYNTNVYGGYPYNVYGGCGFGCGGGFGSSFNFGLFYSNVRSPAFVNPVVYSAPIVYSTPIVTQPVTYTAPVTYATPQYNVQSYLPSYNYNYQAPSCSITASNSNLNYNYYNYTNNNYYGGQTLLTWYSNGANSAYLSPSVGSVSTSGSTTVFSPGGQTYTLTVSGPGGIATCQTTAYSSTYAYNYTPPQVYNNYVAPAPAYQAPTTPYVALTQIPYTGLDFGPVGNALYWLSLVLFAVAGAYLIVYYRGGGLALMNDFLGADGPTGPWSAPVDGPVPARSSVRAEKVVSKPEPIIPASRSRQPFGTKDVMTTVKPTNGEAPRIVIVRE